MKKIDPIVWWLLAGLGVLILGGVAVAKWVIPAAGQQYAGDFASAEAANNLPHNILARMAQQESNFIDAIVQGIQKSVTGAIGLMQFEPATAAQFDLDPTDPVASIQAAGLYMRQIYDDLRSTFGSVATWGMAIGAYNAGIGNVEKAVQAAIAANDVPNWLAYLPTSAANQAQTDAYVSNIAGDLGLTV